MSVTVEQAEGFAVFVVHLLTEQTLIGRLAKDEARMTG